MKKKFAGSLIKNEEKWQQRVLVGSPMTGLVRSEWVNARYHQIIPTAWSQIECNQFMSSYIPLGYQVADAYNLIAKMVVEGDFEWLITIEHDNVLPLDGFIRMNQYMIEKKVPIVSSLYFTKSVPPEPMVYRGIGKGYYDNWKLGDRVWVSGVPMGFTLISASLIKAMWKDAPEYQCSGQVTRRVFITPNEIFIDPEKGGFVTNSGTQDLDFCKRIVEGDYFTKAGWPEFAKMKYPFLVDTNIFCRHITQQGVQYPLSIPPQYIPDEGYKGQELID